MTQPIAPTRRQEREVLHQLVRLESSVAREEFVGAVSTQHNLDVLRGQPAQHVGGHDRSVGQRLVQAAHDLGKQVRRVLQSQDLFVMLGAKDGRDAPRVGRLVVAPVIEADGETVQPAAGLLSGERGDGAGIDSTREEKTDRHVATQPFLDRVPQDGKQILSPFINVAIAHWIVLERDVPVAIKAQSVAVEEEKGAGFDFVDSLENRVRRRDVTVGEIFADRERLKPARDPRMGQQRLEFRGENQLSIPHAIVERLHSDSVARQEKSLLRAIPDRESEHAVTELQSGHTIERELLEQDFGVGVSLKNAAALFEPGAQLDVIINLAVIDDVITPIPRLHRLATVSRSMMLRRR